MEVSHRKLTDTQLCTFALFSMCLLSDDMKKQKEERKPSANYSWFCFQYGYKWVLNGSRFTIHIYGTAENNLTCDIWHVSGPEPETFVGVQPHTCNDWCEIGLSGDFVFPETWYPLPPPDTHCQHKLLYFYSRSSHSVWLMCNISVCVFEIAYTCMCAGRWPSLVLIVTIPPIHKQNLG